MAISPRKKVAGGGDRGQNIQVFVRCRPLNGVEKDARSYSVVDCPNSREVTVKEKSLSNHQTKTFQFDKVFGVQSKQIEVYRAVVEPLILQVMQGYNCTVFAYGQTGTGKTFTMEGGDGREEAGVTWENDPTSGIIPRALAQVFDELRVQQDTEFTVRVSFLELYNEEIFDLLSANDDTTRLRLFEDSTRKGSVIVQGLEEALVQNKAEVFKILEKGSAKRKTATTLMNAHSSRSHTVFTVTVHIKESSAEGEEVLRIGKLNLVDLAGSENIGRSGAMDKRAREAGNINQSLLTLGRVITCLVDRAPHVPYRESKLTRLLQDSLGGRTKTSIIATISPAGINLEETLSTLDYAHRAKNICNKPEVNQKMSKSAKLKEYTEEIEKLRKDLIASREKNGVFLDNSRYQDMINQIEMGNQEMAEKINAIKAMTEEMAKLEELFEEVSSELKEKEADLNIANGQLQETEETLDATKVVLRRTAQEKEEQTHLVEKHVETESKLKDQAKRLMETADMSSRDLKHIHDKMDRLKKLDAANFQSKETFSENFEVAVKDIVDNLETYGSGHEEECGKIKGKLGRQLDRRIESLSTVGDTLRKLLHDQNSATDEVEVLRNHIISQETKFVEEQIKVSRMTVASHKENLTNFESQKINPLLSQVSSVLDDQVKELEQMKTSLSNEFQKLVDTVNTFSVVVNENVLGLKSAVESYAEKNQTRMETLKSKNNEIRESENSFKILLESLMKNYMQHSSLVSGNSSTMSTVSEEDLKDARALVTKSKEISNTIDKSQEHTVSSFDEKHREVTEIIKDSSAKCNDLSSKVDAVSRDIGKEAKCHVEDSVRSLEGAAEEVREKFQSHMKLQESKIQQLKETMSDNTSNLDIVGQAVIEKLHEIQVRDNEAAGVMDDMVGEISNNTKDIIIGLQSKVVEEKEAVSSFIRDDLQEDVPSGLTPARVERPYPRYLAATSPHDKIVSRYREQAALAAAARLALDESDDGDSVASASTGPVLSRQNSLGESTPETGLSRANSTEAKRTPSVSRTPSNSRPGSRAASRENSSNEMRRTKSTSEYGSEIGDAENQDPNFRKPKAVKREIKKPEIRASSRGRKPMTSN